MVDKQVITHGSQGVATLKESVSVGRYHCSIKAGDKLFPCVSCGNSCPEFASICIKQGRLLIDMAGTSPPKLSAQLNESERIAFLSRKIVRVEVPITLSLRGESKEIVASSSARCSPDKVLIAALRTAHAMLRFERGLPIVETASVSPYDRKILRLAFLAPELQRDILKVHQPSQINLRKLLGTDIPICWQKQRRALGWHAPIRN